MQITLTKSQAAAVKPDRDPVFVRAAFYTGHSMSVIMELASAEVLKGEREQIKRLAAGLGMTEADIVKVKQ